MAKTVITNIGTIVSGDVRKPLLKGDTIVCQDGKIGAVGFAKELDIGQAEFVIDAVGMAVTPGLIDPHTHPAIGDWTPRQKSLDWMEGALNAGVTTLISQGAVMVQGRPTDPAGAKALAILGAKTSQNFRPGGGLKTHQGTIILDAGLTEADFREMAENGVEVVAEIGGSGLYKPEDVKEMVGWARKYKMTIGMHCGGRSIPGSAKVWADMIMEVKPDIIIHLNGGSTGAPWAEVEKLITQTDFMIEVIYNGNPKLMYDIVELLKGRDELHRLVLGSDTPIGIGLIPTAILRCIVQVSSLNKIPAEKVIAMASGTTAGAYKLNTGKIEVGREADLLLMAPPADSVSETALKAIGIGDTPAIGIIIIDGQIVTTRARNTGQSTTLAKINGRDVSAPGIQQYLFGR